MNRLNKYSYNGTTFRVGDKVEIRGTFATKEAGDVRVAHHPESGTGEVEAIQGYEMDSVAHNTYICVRHDDKLFAYHPDDVEPQSQNIRATATLRAI